LAAIVSEYVGQSTLGDVPHTELPDTPADRMVARLLMRSPAPPEGSLPFRLYVRFTEFHSHKWMYDGQSLARRMTAAGIENVRVCGYLDSSIQGIADVEQADRITDGRGVCVEGHTSCQIVGSREADSVKTSASHR
jgi:hypothetical protein